MKKQPNTSPGESLLFRSSIFTVVSFFVIVILSNLGHIQHLSFWFFVAPIYFFCITLLYSFFIDKKNAVNSSTFFSMYPMLILVKLICTASLIVIYTELGPNPQLAFWILVVVLYFMYSTLIAVSLYKYR